MLLPRSLSAHDFCNILRQSFYLILILPLSLSHIHSYSHTLSPSSLPRTLRSSYPHTFNLSLPHSHILPPHSTSLSPATTSLSLPSSQDLLEGCHIIVGTPGRLTGLLDSKTLDLSQIKFFILDEADALAFGENLQSVKNINDVFLYSIFFLFFSYSLHQSFIFYSYI